MNNCISLLRSYFGKTLTVEVPRAIETFFIVNFVAKTRALAELILIHAVDCGDQIVTSNQSLTTVRMLSSAEREPCGDSVPITVCHEFNYRKSFHSDSVRHVILGVIGGAPMPTPR